jgi:hypothetical protein
MLQWGSLRHEGFTGGAVETGFESFNPEAVAEARRSAVLDEHRRRSMGSASASSEREGMLKSKSSAAFIAVGGEKKKRDSDHTAFLHAGDKVVEEAVDEMS